jgi:hypothetical protein
MLQCMKFVDSTYFGHQHARQEYRWLIPHLVANRRKIFEVLRSGAMVQCVGV